MKEKQTRPEAYPKPTETDNQLKNQAEFIDQEPNEISEKSVGGIPGGNIERQSTEPTKDSERGGE